MHERILLVDDSPTALMLQKMLLADLELDIVTASNGIEGIEVARATEPALIVMDVLMPEMNGLEALRRLRADPKFSSVPIIMVTARSEAASINEAYAAGCTDYLIKPFDGTKLIAKVQHYLSSSDGGHSPPPTPRAL